MGLNDIERNTVVTLQREKAHKFISQAKLMCNQSFWDLAANRYYYACYHIIQALFIQRGLSAKTHSGLLRTFGQNYIMTNIVDDKFGPFLAKLMQLRIKADYNCSFNASEADVTNIAKGAEELVDVIDAML